jgi:hypothetical protein
MPLPDTNSGCICYSSLRFPPTASRKRLEKTTARHGWRGLRCLDADMMSRGSP